ncbi:MAG: endo-1,4-beta-xylanase, partial [Blastocatellia bacterium]|nr:endo-1,4-beta-xylanase [Blastocatellia bacterium]
MSAQSKQKDQHIHEYSAAGTRAVVSLLAIFLCLCLPIIASAQEGVSLLPNNIFKTKKRVGANATATPVEVSGQSFDRGYRIAVTGTSRDIADARLRYHTTAAVSQGDNLQIAFWVRKIAPLNGDNIRGFVGFLGAGRSGASSLLTPFPCDSDVWTKYVIPFKAAADYPAGEAEVIFQFAYGPQTFEIGGLSAIDLGPTPPPPPTAASVLPEDVYNSSFFYIDSTVGGQVTPITVTGQSFTQGYQIRHDGDSAFVYNSGLGWNTAAPIARNDLLQLTFWARKLEPAGSGIIRGQVVFERNGGDYEKSLTANYPNDSDQWRLFQMVFRSSADFAPTEAHLVFQFAYGPQLFEIGGISLINYGQNVSPEQLSNYYYYPTRGDATAPWRVAANERIDQMRKGDLIVKVEDRNGHHLPGATVYIQQTNHAFRFGSAVTAAHIMGQGVDNDIYRSRVTSHFTTTVFENDLKWGLWECETCGTSFNKDQTRAAIVWLTEHSLPIRGHNLIWPSWNFMPANLMTLGPNELRQAIDARFNDVLGDAGVNGKLYEWDVINEPYANYDVMGRIGVDDIPQSNGVLPNEEMIHWFQLARTLDQRPRLFVNDYDIIAAGGDDVRHQDYYYALLKWLIDNGAPIGGAGLQGHFTRITPFDRMEAILARFSQLPVALAVTEFDFTTLDEDLQAEYMRDVLTMIFSQPKIDDFLMWGFWANAHYQPIAAMYRADWSSKPAALAWNDMLFREWWT